MHTSRENEAEGKNLLRHIRNSIAHTHAKVFNKKGTNYFEFEDFGIAEGKKNKQHIFFPIKYLEDIYKIYIDIEKKAKNNI
ncbi:MAG: hypothetical protein Q4A42_04745 [Tissierellia bacterium]|nr:hypothetical protein [Tissierellia bacterium]